MEFQNKKNNKQYETKENTLIKKKFHEFIEAGIDFIGSILSKHPITLTDFLDSSEKHFDNLIIEISKKEHLKYIGGKLILVPQFDSAKSYNIQVEADLYFQNAQQKWINKKFETQVASNNILDCDSEPELEELRNGNSIEFLIEPPVQEKN